jgi:hypothetical protein
MQTKIDLLSRAFAPLTIVLLASACPSDPVVGVSDSVTDAAIDVDAGPVTSDAAIELIGEWDATVEPDAGDKTPAPPPDAALVVPRVGQPCDVGASYSDNQGLWNGDAPECAERLCIKPAAAPSVPRPVGTGSLCTAACTVDADCNGDLRDPLNSRDQRCKSGFACAVAFELGPYACKRVCVCRDFYPPTGPVTPASCTQASAP